MKIEITAHIRSIEGKSEHLKAEIIKLVAQTVQEKGCLEFKVFQDTEDASHFILWEIFATQQALDDHLQKEYTREYFNCGFVEETKVTRHQAIC